MADLTERVILQVKLDYGDALKQNADVAQQISQVKDSMKQLSDQGKQNTVEYEAQKTVFKSLQDQYRLQQKAVQDSINANKSEEGSIKQLRSQVTLMTNEYISLSKAERDSAKGVEMQKSIRSKTDELKKLEGALGDNRRNVGNYLDVMRGFDGPFGRLITGLRNAKDSFTSLKGGIDPAAQGFSGFNGILKASVIGVIITLLGGLIAAFTKFEPLMDRVSQVMAGANAVIDVFVERLTRIDRGLTEIFSGNFAEGINMVRDSFDGMGASMVNAAVSASRLEEAFQNLEDRQRAQIVANADAEKQVAQLILQAKNRTLSEKDRLAFLEQAGKIENENFEANKRNSEEAYRIALEQARLKTTLSNQEIEELLTNTDRREELEKRIGTLSGEELTKLAERKAETIRLESETINVLERIANRRDMLLQESEKKREEAAKKQAAILAKQIEKEKKLLEAREKQAREFEQFEKQKYEELLSMNDKYFKDKETMLLNALESGKITQQQFDDQMAADELSRLQTQAQIQRSHLESTVDTENEIAQKKVDIKRRGAEAEKRIEEAKQKFAQDAVNSGAKLLTAATSLAKEGTNIQKAAALASVGVNLGTALSNIVATSSAPTPDNLATGGIAGFVKHLAYFAEILTAIASAKSIISAAAGGGEFMTKGPTLLLVGDNPGGVEKVSVSPISGRGQTRVAPGGNLVAMAGGGELTAFGGYAERSSTTLGSVIDYDMLAQSMARVQIVTKLTDLERVNAIKAKISQYSKF